jgi:hypothetical protein
LDGVRERLVLEQPVHDGLELGRAGGFDARERCPLGEAQVHRRLHHRIDVARERRAATGTRR